MTNMSDKREESGPDDGSEVEEIEEIQPNFFVRPVKPSQAVRRWIAEYAAKYNLCELLSASIVPHSHSRDLQDEREGEKSRESEEEEEEEEDEDEDEAIEGMTSRFMQDKALSSNMVGYSIWGTICLVFEEAYDTEEEEKKFSTGFGDIIDLAARVVVCICIYIYIYGVCIGWVVSSFAVHFGGHLSLLCLFSLFLSLSLSLSVTLSLYPICVYLCLYFSSFLSFTSNPLPLLARYI